MNKAGKINHFDKKTCGIVGDTSFSMLQALAKQHGLELTKERGLYTDDSYTFKVTFRTVGASGQPGDFVAKASRVGIPTDCWGKVFTTTNGTYRVVDVKPRNTKYPVIAEKITNKKRYKVAVRDVVNGLL